MEIVTLVTGPEIRYRSAKRLLRSAPNEGTMPAASIFTLSGERFSLAAFFWKLREINQVAVETARRAVRFSV